MARNIILPEALYELPAASPSSKSIEREGRDVAVIIVLIIIVEDIKSVPRRARARSVGSEVKATKRIGSVMAFFTLINTAYGRVKNDASRSFLLHLILAFIFSQKMRKDYNKSLFGQSTSKVETI